MTNHGGPRPGAGRKPGTRNRTRKPDRDRRTVKQQVTFTPAEWSEIQFEIEPIGFNQWAREKLLK